MKNLPLLKNSAILISSSSTQFHTSGISPNNTFLVNSSTTPRPCHSPPLHIYFIPLPPLGHVIPMVDVAKLFAKHNVECTLILNPLNTSGLNSTIYHSNLKLLTFEFPSVSGLPMGCESTDVLPSPDLLEHFAMAIDLLEKPFRELLRRDGTIYLGGWQRSQFHEVVDEVAAVAGESGQVVKGWAPQLAILGHIAVSTFVTHCGRLLQTWPLFGEQFYNEKFVVEVARNGESMGAKRGVVLSREKVAKRVRWAHGTGAEAVRKRAWDIRLVVRREVVKGGSSYASVDCMIEDIRQRREKRNGGNREEI